MDKDRKKKLLKSLLKIAVYYGRSLSVPVKIVTIFEQAAKFQDFLRAQQLTNH